MEEIRQVVPAPDALVMDKTVQHGVFDAPPRDVNMMDADFLGLGGATPRWLRALRLKQWQFYLVTHPRFAAGFVILDFGYTASSFFYLYDREQDKLLEHRRLKLDRNVGVARSLWEGRCHFNANKYSIEIHNALNQGMHEVKIDIAASSKSPRIAAEMKFHTNGGTHPLVVSLPVGKGRFMYSVKTIHVASGTLRYGDTEYTLDPTRDTAALDEHKAFYPRHTYWKWATFGFIAEGGRATGVNLTDNLIADQRRWNENAILLPDRVDLLGPVHFIYDLSDIMKQWRIYDDDGRVELTFTPQAVKYDQTNMLLIRVDYRQPVGLFNGRLTDSQGKVIEVRDVLGVTEHFNAHY